MSINKHGMKIVNIKAASAQTSNWPQGSGGYCQISYNKSTGEVLVADHVGNSWTNYDDLQIIHVCDTERHMTMQELADAVWQAVE